MKKSHLLILALFLLNITYGKHYKAYVIYNSKGKQVDLDKIVKSTEGKKYVFFGEYHNNPICHWLEFELIRNMHTVYKKKLTIGAEMMESDNQFVIDEYLNDLISATSFQNEVRLWSNYNTDYKPIIEYSRKNKIPFVATNIPRRYANMVYKKGLKAIDELTDLAKSYIVPMDEFVFDSTVSCYKKLIHSSEDHSGFELARAQAIKDATMAYFIQKNANEKGIFFHLNGTYHSDNYQGIIHYLEKNVLRKKILSISTVEQKNISKLENGNKGLADFVICIPKSMTKTH